MAPSAGPAFVAPPAALRRLTASQHARAVRALLGDVSVPIPEPDVRFERFVSIGTTVTSVSPVGVERYEQAAREAVRTVFADVRRRTDLVGCEPKGTTDDACARGFLERFARRAWRRKPTVAEVTRKAGLAASVGTALSDPWAGVEHAASAVLQSPWFLYRVELGEPDGAASGRLRLTGRELASRLAFTLWDAPPDDALLDAGERGELSDATGLRKASARLLADARAADAVAAWAREVFQLEQMDRLSKDAGLFPSFGPALRQSMQQEISLAFHDAALGRASDLRGLLDTNQTFVDAELAGLYGVAKPASGFSIVTLPSAGRRTGLLGKSGMLALRAKANDSSPTARGRFVSEALLCRPVPEPPDDVMVALPPEPDSGARTKRERFQAHRSNPTCAGCHSALDPFGLALESFDAIGAERATDRGLSIDASGALDGATFADARELGGLLAKHADVAACFARNAYRMAIGRHEQEGDEGVIRAMAAGFAAGGHSYHALMAAIVGSDGFRFVRAPEN